LFYISTGESKRVLSAIEYRSRLDPLMEIKLMCIKQTLFSSIFLVKQTRVWNIVLFSRVRIVQFRQMKAKYYAHIW